MSEETVTPGGIIIPAPALARVAEVALVDVDGICRRYREAHRCCPKCGSADFSETTKGTIIREGMVDTNQAWCHGPGCGWTGITHDRVPEAKP